VAAPQWSGFALGPPPRLGDDRLPLQVPGLVMLVIGARYLPIREIRGCVTALGCHRPRNGLVEVTAAARHRMLLACMVLFVLFMS
jgi:hypothetical protein